MDTIFRFIIISIIFTLFSIELILTAAVYAKPRSLFEPFEQLCSNKTERYVKGDGKESSLFLELRSNLQNQNRKYCERNLTAPESHGFIVRLVIPKLKKTIGKNYGTNTQSKFRGLMMNQQISDTQIDNSTKNCPLTIYSQSDTLHEKPLWRIDPCQLELEGNNQEDPVRLFDGHLNIVWEHGDNSIDSKLMITALGKGYGCNSVAKHPCLKVGDEALFCISKDLICDNIRHCPKGDEYNSDEDFDMCMKLNRPVASLDDGDFWEHLTMEIFKTFFTSDAGLPTGLDVNIKNNDKTNDDDSSINKNNKNNDINDEIKFPDFDWKTYDNGKVLPNDIKTNDINDVNSDVKRNSTKTTLSGDLSKYGPWGYLMLGMLMCGGALLVCGLWECCCRRNKSDTTINASTISGGIDIIEPSGRIQDSTPPNYEELDPPPSYSILFPNQKANNDIPTTSSTLTNIPTVTGIVLQIENSQNNYNTSSTETIQISTS